MFQEEQALIAINRVKASVKDVKVTGKGIQLNLENVQLTGEQISLVSALVGGQVWVEIEERLPETKGRKQEAEGQLSFFAGQETEEEEYELPEETLSNEEVEQELGI